MEMSRNRITNVVEGGSGQAGGRQGRDVPGGWGKKSIKIKLLGKGERSHEGTLGWGKLKGKKRYLEILVRKGLSEAKVMLSCREWVRVCFSGTKFKRRMYDKRGSFKDCGEKLG